jgi:hypothetical protein
MGNNPSGSEPYSDVVAHLCVPSAKDLGISGFPLGYKAWIRQTRLSKKQADGNVSRSQASWLLMLHVILVCSASSQLKQLLMTLVLHLIMQLSVVLHLIVA